MKKKVLLLISALFILLQMNAEGVIELATKSGYVKNAGDKTVFYETDITLKAKTISWARVGYVEVPISETSDAIKVDFSVYFYKCSATGTYPVSFATMPGSIPSDIGFTNQPDDADFTSIGDVDATNDDFKWLTVDITAQYNAALQAGEKALTIRLISEDASAMLQFYSLATGTSNKPYIEVSSNCPRKISEIDTVLVDGESLQVGDVTCTQSGTYIDSAFTACGSDSITTFNVLFITDGEIVLDATTCAGSDYIVQTGPTTYKSYDEAGTYRDTITAVNGQQVTVTTLSMLDLPSPQDLGNDVEIREDASVVLDAGSGFSAYQWYNNEVAIEGATAQTLTVEISNTAFSFGTNEISVEVTDANGCIGADDVWVDIIGNFVSPARDMYLEEAGDRLLDIARLEVKYDTWGDSNSETPTAPYYTKEIHLAFDFTDADLPTDISNVKLRMYLYDVAGNAKQPSPDTTVSISCDYADGLYAEDMIYTTRTEASERTPLSQPLTVNPSMINSFVEWDINDVFMDDVLGKKNQFSIILSISNDAYSVLAKFKDMSNSNVGLRPAITFDVSDASAISETELSAAVVLAPNPVENTLMVKGGDVFTKATIYNLQGRVVSAVSLTNNTIDVSSLVSGNYIVTLQNDKQLISKMIIKK